MCRCGDQQLEDGLNKLRTALSSVLPGAIPADPLIEELADDPVVAEFQPEACFSGETCCVCLIFTACYPLNAPSYACACLRMCFHNDVFRGYAKARRIVLREHSLLYELDKEAPSHPMGLCCCGEATVVTEPVRILLLLTDDFSFEPINGTDMSTMALKIKGHIVAYITLSSVLPDMSGTAISGFLEKVNAQKQAQTFLPPPKISQISKQKHEAILAYHQFITAPPQSESISPELLSRQGAAFYEDLISKMETPKTGAPTPDEMSRGGSDQVVVAQPAPIEAQAVQATHSTVTNMTVDEVSNVLKSLQLEQYSVGFEKASVNGYMLSILDDATLIELGVTSGLDRKRILAWVLEHK